MGRFRGITATCAAALVTGAMLTSGVTGAGAVSAAVKLSVDPCTVLTQADLAGLSTAYTIDGSSSELDHTCTYQLLNDGSHTPLMLSIESAIGYTAQKAVAKNKKAIPGLPGGYTGQVNGSSDAAYKSGKTGIRVSDGDLSTADLAKILKSIHKRLG